MKQTAYIVIDSGFDSTALQEARNVLSFFDVPASRQVNGSPVMRQDQLQEFAGDNAGNHGSEVLRRLLKRVPDAPLVLVRCIGTNGRIARTQWSDGVVSRKGWADAYLEAVDFCRQRKYNTVANCSFGGYIHAMDGTGWEAHCIGQVSGAGKPGNVLVAAAGAGDGSARHASMLVAPGNVTVTRAFQENQTHYNFWAKSDCHWTLRVKLDGHDIMLVDSDSVPANLWNGLKQQTFVVPGSGIVTLEVYVEKPSRGLAAFDCWVEGDSSFLNNIDPVNVVEPACFPVSLAVGLRAGKYSPRQGQLKEKPDVLLAGHGPISFRLPEVTAAVGRLLEHDPGLDLQGVRGLLGKYPDPAGF